MARVNQAEGLLAPVGEEQGMADHFALEIDVGFGKGGHTAKLVWNHCHARETLPSPGPLSRFDRSGFEFASLVSSGYDEERAIHYTYDRANHFPEIADRPENRTGHVLVVCLRAL